MSMRKLPIKIFVIVISIAVLMFPPVIVRDQFYISTRFQFVLSRVELGGPDPSINWPLLAWMGFILQLLWSFQGKAKDDQ